MSIKFKILSVNPEQHSVVVRYFSDLVSEDDLATEFDAMGKIVRDQNGSPVRCRTDYNIEIFHYPSPDKDKMIEIISSNAPRTFFDKFKHVNDPMVDTSMAAAHFMVNRVYDVTEPEAPTVLDVEQLLDQLLSNTST